MHAKFIVAALLWFLVSFFTVAFLMLRKTDSAKKSAEITSDQKGVDNNGNPCVLSLFQQFSIQYAERQDYAAGQNSLGQRGMDDRGNLLTLDLT